MTAFDNWLAGLPKSVEELRSALQRLEAWLSEKVAEFRPNYGGISAVDNTTATTISASNTPVKIDIYDANMPSYGMVPDFEAGTVEIRRTAPYMVAVSATVNTGSGAASRFEMTVCRDNGNDELPGLHVDRNVAGGGGSSGSASMSGIVELQERDVLEVWITNETNTTNYTLENITLSVIRVG